MSDTTIPRTPEVEFIPPTVEEAAFAMFTGVQANLLSFARGECDDFKAVFASGYDSWLNATDSYERIHGLALERFYAANESRAIESNGQKYVTMTILDGNQAYERVLNMIEYPDDYGKVYQVIISS